MSDWTADLESTIFSIIKSKTYASLTGTFPNIKYTMVESTTASTRFPTVYIHVISMSEEGQDLQGQSINAVLASFQVDVTSNTTEADVKTVIYEIISALKELRFSITSFPIFTTEDDVHRAVVRARRMIGSGDILL